MYISLTAEMSIGEASMDMSAVSEIYIPPAGVSPREVAEQTSRLETAFGGSDRLIVIKKPGDLIIVDGVLKSIDPETIGFSWKDADRKVARKTVAAVMLASGSRPAEPPAGFFVARDGSTLTFSSIEFDGRNYTLRSPTAGEVVADASAAAEIRFTSAKAAALSDLKPEEVREYGYFDRVFHYRVNRSAGGGPLMLGGREYPAGLGMHSFCRLGFRLDGQYKKFVAQAGIDDDAAPAGNAVLSFEGDGKPLGRPVRLRGRQPPHTGRPQGPPETIRLDLTGVKVFTIQVDFGDGLDVGDHVDIVSPRLIK